MPVRLSKTGASAIGPGGRVEKRFGSRKAAKAYVTARALAHARSKGYRVPAAKRRKSK